jgi:hypothetical protein
MDLPLVLTVVEFAVVLTLLILGLHAHGII